MLALDFFSLSCARVLCGFVICSGTRSLGFREAYLFFYSRVVYEMKRDLGFIIFLELGAEDFINAGVGIQCWKNCWEWTCGLSLYIFYVALYVSLWNLYSSMIRTGHMSCYDLSGLKFSEPERKPRNIASILFRLLSSYTNTF